MPVKNKWSIHAVLVSTKLKKPEAKKIAIDIIHKQPEFYRKTKDHHRFDNITADHFTKFRSKVINDNVSIIFGLLKQDSKLEGGSIGSFIKKGIEKVKDKVKEVFTPRNGYNNKSSSIIKQFGNEKIKTILIIRAPIEKFIKIALNVISLGKFNESLKKTPYDDLYHLSMNIQLENNTTITIEKNEVINIQKGAKPYKNSEKMVVSLKGKELTLNQLLEAGYKNAGSDSKYFQYDGFENNCQNYIMYLLNGSGLSTPEIKKFVLQDITKLIEDSPEYAKKFGSAATTIAGVADKLLGNGMIEGHKVDLDKLDLDDLLYVIKKYDLKIKSKTKKGIIKLILNDKYHKLLMENGFFEKLHKFFSKEEVKEEVVSGKGEPLEYALKSIGENIKGGKKPKDRPSKLVKMNKKELINEHKELINTLLKGNKSSRSKEAVKQAKELKKYEK